MQEQKKKHKKQLKVAKRWQKLQKEGAFAPKCNLVMMAMIDFIFPSEITSSFNPQTTPLCY